MQKKCSKCKQIKDLSCFSKHARHADGYASECKECKNSIRRTDKYREQANKARREWFAKNPGKNSEYTRNFRETEKGKRYTKEFFLKKYYNITIDEYNELFEQQEGRCAICGTHQSELLRSLAVDHSHETGEMRGLLCGKCNTAIGLLNEDMAIINNLIEYLNNTSR